MLTGWSRGASLAVLVGGARHAPPQPGGHRRDRADGGREPDVSSDTDDDPDDKPVGAQRVEPRHVCAAGAGGAAAVRRDPVDRRRLPAREPCAGAVRADTDTAAVLRGDGEEPPLQRRRGGVRGGRCEVSAGLGVPTWELSCSAEPQPGSASPVTTQILAHLVLPVRPVVAAARTPVVHVVPDALARQDFRQRVGQVGSSPTGPIRSPAGSRTRQLLVGPTDRAGWPCSRPGCGSRSCRRTCPPMNRADRRSPDSA